MCALARKPPISPTPPTAQPTATASPSPSTVVIRAPGFDRSFLHCPGANDTFSATDVDPAQVADAALFLLGYPPIMRRMFEENSAELRALLRSVQAQGVATSLDTAHVDPESATGRVDWRSLLTRVLPHVDFFLPSLDEGYAMLDPAGFAAVRATLHATLHAPHPGRGCGHRQNPRPSRHSPPHGRSRGRDQT